MSTFKQNPQIKRSKHFLQEAFLELLKEKPYKKITVTDVVKRAELSRTTFYAHYDYMEELIDECLDDLLMNIIDNSFSNVTTFPPSPEQERIYISKLVSHWQGNHFLFRSLAEAGLEKIILAKYMEKHRLFFREKVEERLPFSPSKELIDYYLVFISSTQIGILQYWLATDMQMPVEQLVDFLTVVNSPGLFMKLSSLPYMKE
jgi:AcrR family transcriptional regulator